MPGMPWVDLGREATYADLAGVPDHVVAEIVDGVLWTSPRPAPAHARAQTSLTGILAPAYDHARGGPGGWWILMEPELHLSRDVLVPDLAGWRRERMPQLPETAFFAVAPDWVCEVTSPETAALDRRKLRVYAREGVRHAWVVDPLKRSLDVFQLDAGRWTRAPVQARGRGVTAEPFDGVDLELALLWADPVESSGRGA
jgi:Uma2 family endonuclease